MATYLAAPYGTLSTAIETADGVAFELLAPGCFARSLAARPRVRLTRGHGGATIRRVRPYETAAGLFFKYSGALPERFSGFSVNLTPVRWERIGPQTFRLIEARLRHIALLVSPDVPAYEQTYSFAKG